MILRSFPITSKATIFESRSWTSRCPGSVGFNCRSSYVVSLRETKVIIITGRPDSEIRTLALTGGAFGFLAKPIDDEAFLSSVRQALGE